MRSFVFCLLLLAGAFSEAAAQRSWTLPSQEAIAADLRSDNLDTLSRGMLYVDHIPYQDWTPALRSAILYALASEIQRDREAMRLGVHRFKDDGTTAFLAEYAIVMQDPAAIPSLGHGIGVGEVRASGASGADSHGPWRR